MYRSYNQAIGNLKNIKNVKQLKERVAIYLLKNKHKDIIEGLSFLECFEREQSGEHDAGTYECFCGNIITKQSYRDNELMEIEKHAIHIVDVEEGKRNSTRKLFTCIGERVEDSGHFYVLASFVNGEENAKEFITNYTRLNPFVKTRVVVSNMEGDFPCDVINTIITKKVMKANPVSLKTILKKRLFKSDESIVKIIDIFPIECERFIELKQRGMEEDAGLVWNILEKVRDIYEGIDDLVILKKLRKSLAKSNVAEPVAEPLEDEEIEVSHQVSSTPEDVVMVEEGEPERPNKRKRSSVERYMMVPYNNETDRTNEDEDSGSDDSSEGDFKPCGNNIFSEPDEDYDSTKDEDESELDEDIPYEFFSTYDNCPHVTSIISETVLSSHEVFERTKHIYCDRDWLHNKLIKYIEKNLPDEYADYPNHYKMLIAFNIYLHKLTERGKDTRKEKQALKVGGDSKAPFGFMKVTNGDKEAIKPYGIKCDGMIRIKK